MPPPAYACTIPPYSSTARLIIVTHSPTSALTSSGVSPSPSAVEPTMSAKRTVTGRSSSSAFVGTLTHGVFRAPVAPVTFVADTSCTVEWPLLADLPPEDVHQLLSIARRRTFEKGEIVFHRD